MSAPASLLSQGLPRQVCHNEAMRVGIVDFESATAGAQLVQSLHQTGFAVIVNHPISWQLVEGVYQEWDAFFNSEQKFNYTYSRERQDGYFPRPSDATAGSPYVNARDDKEFYHLFSWGRFPSEVSEMAVAYKEAATDFAAQLLRLIGVHSPEHVAAGFPHPLQDLLIGSEKNTLLRILRYPPLPRGNIGEPMRAGAHKDANLLTLLPCGSEPGLQVLARGVWEDLPWDPESMVVNGGVMLDLLSRSYYPAGEHRVAPPHGEAKHRSRLAMPLFLHPADDVLLDGKQTASEFLSARLKATYSTTATTR